MRGHILRGLDINVFPGEKVAMVGESGSGKSVTSLAAINLLPSRKMKITQGTILLNGKDLTRLEGKQWGDIRGKLISIIFQDPLAALNPLMTVGDQVREALSLLDEDRNDSENIYGKVIRLFSEMGLPDAERICGLFPHQLSGGMCQRVCIAMALVSSPQLLIADEPTTALDVTVQSQILKILDQEMANRKFTLLFITHNIRMMEWFSDRIAVVYGGQVVEIGKTSDVFKRPNHPYTASLLSSLGVDEKMINDRKRIYGSTPRPEEKITGCVYFDRCSRAKPECSSKSPGWSKIEKGNSVRCFYPL